MTAKRRIEVAMAKAVLLQQRSNDDDLKWLRERRDLNQEVRDEVFSRMVARVADNS